MAQHFSQGRMPRLPASATMASPSAAGQGSVKLPSARHKVLINVLPKNGTHLLLNLLDALPGYGYQGVDIDLADEARALRVLTQMQPGEVVKAHLPWRESLEAAIARNGIRMLSMDRDPRDNVVSLVHYLIKHPQHPLHAAYARLADFDQRLLGTIAGFEHQGQRVIRDIGSRLRDWQRWRELGVLHLRFEELIGGADAQAQAAQQGAVRQVLDQLDLDPARLDLPAIQRSIFDPTAHSFRSGRSGGWREVFQPHHVAAFKTSANWALLELGYETDEDWYA